MRRLVAIFALLLGLMFPWSAKAGVGSYVTPLMRVKTECKTLAKAGGLFRVRLFDRGWVADVRLDRVSVCRPIRRFWRNGFPKMYLSRRALGHAILTVAHEEQHVEQWEASGSAGGALVPVNSGYSWIEADADCGAAQEFKPWARKLRVAGRQQRRKLQYVIRHPLTIGYDGGRYMAGCWR